MRGRPRCAARCTSRRTRPADSSLFEVEPCCRHVQSQVVGNRVQRCIRLQKKLDHTAAHWRGEGGIHPPMYDISIFFRPDASTPVLAERTSEYRSVRSRQM